MNCRFALPVTRARGRPRPFSRLKLDFASFVDLSQGQNDVVRNAYFNAIANVDRQVGTDCQRTQRVVPNDNTICIVVGEKGESFTRTDGDAVAAVSQVQTQCRWS